ncbi:MAG TPA: hypothetical protein VES95_14065, partial [Dermatophilaceae bacterium]|nr:hypothetical protein [Dermatophilaceae bacterium]
MSRGDVLRAGDVVNGYRLLGDFRVVGAGLSEWTFGERGGRTFFVKRFLSPTYPDDAAPGSPTTKARKRARCAAFEAHHRGIQAAMAPLTTYGGNLIATLDFFQVGAKYYKVTEKVDIAGLEPAYIARLDFGAQLVLLKTVAHSLKILHDLQIVHSDRTDRFPQGCCECGTDLAGARDLGVVDRYQQHEVPLISAKTTQYDQHS